MFKTKVNIFRIKYDYEYKVVVNEEATQPPIDLNISKG